MEEEILDNPHLVPFYEYMDKGNQGPNPYSFPLQQHFMMERFKKEKEEKYFNDYLIQD